MFISPTEVLAILEHYKYFLIFPIAIIEGPIIIIITGFLVYLGYLNGFVAYSVLVVADIIGDSMYYGIGKLWKKSALVKKWAKIIGYDENSEAFLEDHFRKHKGKTFLLAKISHGIGGAVQVSSGIAGVNYFEFLTYSVLGTIPKAALLFFVGYYAGSSYVRIDSYFDFIAKITLTLSFLLVIYFILSKYAKRYLTSKNDNEIIN
ncbi:MAG: DedA family protein [Parcubacteria bacterium C7867-006]|nr:MAG: DedA family protein [Parcubacteria bacterium C7867-006]